MAIVFTNQGASANPDILSGADASSYTNTAWTPPTSGLLCCFVYTRENAGLNDYAVTDPFIGNGITWVRIKDLVFGSNSRSRITLWAANASGSSNGANTINFANIVLCCFAGFFSITGVDLGGGIAAAFVQTPDGTGTDVSGSVTLAAAGNSNNRPIVCFAQELQQTVDHDPDWIELDEQFGAGPARGIDTQYRENAFDTLATASWVTSTVWGGVAAEIKADVGEPPPPPTELLNFDPGIYGHGAM